MYHINVITVVPYYVITVVDISILVYMHTEVHTWTIPWITHLYPRIYTDIYVVNYISGSPFINITIARIFCSLTYTIYHCNAKGLILSLPSSLQIMKTILLYLNKAPLCNALFVSEWLALVKTVRKCCLSLQKLWIFYLKMNIL